MEHIISNADIMTFEQLAQRLTSINEQVRQTAVNAVNKMATLRNWLNGAYIVEYEQRGSDRAKYGDQLILKLSKRLGDGFNTTLLKNSRSFYLNYPQVVSCMQKSPTLSDFSSNIDLPISQTLSDKLQTTAETLVSKLSFSHIVELLTISDPIVRYFYETECIRGTWSVRELRRQITSNLHIRVGLSADKDKAMQQINQSAEKDSAALQIRQPFSFEFLGLQAKEVVTEKNIEEALIEHLQEFLLEMGRGFCFEARQKRIIIDDRYYFTDLVFYNRILHCNVIVELKNDEFRHEHIGQLNAYVSYYAENEMHPGDNPPVGILLCTHKGQKMVEYALGSLDNKLFVSTYQLQLPDKQVLEDFIIKECKDF